MKKIIIALSAIALACGVYAKQLKLDVPRAQLTGTPVPIKIDNLDPNKGPAPVMEVPDDVKNLAKGKKVTSSDDMPLIGELELVTDGDKEAGEGCETPEGTQAEAPAQEKSGQADCEADFRESADEEGQEDADDSEEDASKEKKGFFSKKKDKKEEAYKAQIAELQDKVMRQMAEFENFRKRTEKEKSAMFETGAKSVIEKILPVVDNFERGLAMVPEEQKEEPFVEGMTKIYRQLQTELENLGVTAIEAVGKEFDPELHNAVMQVENEELESGTVAQELQKGYKYRDSVVRHSMVAVVQ